MNKERLLKMAEFLEALPPHKFDFAYYITLGNKMPAEALAAPNEHCGTTACAVGWLPAVFPESFKWEMDPQGPRVVSPKSAYGIENSVADFLEIGNRDYKFLFIPGESRLGRYATAIEVAQQIREFVVTDGDIERIF